MTKNELSAWLVTHGFTTNDNESFATPYGKGMLQIDLFDENVRVVVFTPRNTNDDQSDGTFKSLIELDPDVAKLNLEGMETAQKKGPKVSYSRIEYDEDMDAVRGIGLYSSTIINTLNGAETPIWYSQRMIEATSPKAQPDTSSSPKM